MKKIFLLAAAAMLLLAGCGAQKPQGEKLSGSIEDLMAKNKNMRCELMAKDGENVMSGTTYISGTKARSDYQMKMGEQTVTSHMISDGTWMYSWTEEYPNQAVKMKIEDLESDELAEQEDVQSAGIENYEQKFDYDCYNWAIDNSVFTPPSNVNFVDYTEMIKSFQNMFGNLPDESAVNDGANMPNLINTDKASLCGACDAIPDAAAKADCKAQLGCK